MISSRASRSSRVSRSRSPSWKKRSRSPLWKKLERQLSRLKTKSQRKTLCFGTWKIRDHLSCTRHPKVRSEIPTKAQRRLSPRLLLDLRHPLVKRQACHLIEKAASHVRSRSSGAWLSRSHRDRPSPSIAASKVAPKISHSSPVIIRATLKGKLTVPRVSILPPSSRFRAHRSAVQRRKEGNQKKSWSQPTPGMRSCRT